MSTPATTAAPPQRATKPPPCTCPAYRFPHRAGGGLCGPDPDDDGECWTCRGTGEGMWEAQSCGDCRGSGVRRRSRHLTEDDAE